MRYKKTIAIVSMVLLIIALTASALGILNWLFFWVIAAILGLYAFLLQPRLK